MSRPAKAWRRVLVAIALGLIAACDVGRKSDARASTDNDMNRSTAEGDSARVRAFLERHGFLLDSALAVDETDVAVLARKRGVPDTFYVAAVRVRGNSAAFLVAPEQLELPSALPEVKWGRLTPTPTKVLMYRYDAAVEGLADAKIHVIRDGRVVSTTTDSDVVCVPAELRDVNGDGIVELVSYPEDPLQRNCANQCQSMLWREFEIEPAWVRVRAWEGDHWSDAGRRHAAFYAELARRYARAAEWLATGAGAEAQCQNLIPVERVRDWEKRARDLSG